MNRTRLVLARCSLFLSVAVLASPPSLALPGFTAGAQDDSTEVPGAQQDSHPESLTPFARELELLHMALSDEDSSVRGQAAAVLGRRGGMESIRALAPLLSEPGGIAFPYVKGGVSELLGRYDYFTPDVQADYSVLLASMEENLMRIVRTRGDWGRAGSAMFLLNKYPRLRSSTLEEIRTIAAGRENSAFLMALGMLDARGEDVGDLVAGVISTGVNKYDYRLARTLGTCQARHVPEIRLLLESTDLRTLFLAHAALERLGDPESDAGLVNLRALEIERMALTINEVAMQRLERSTWTDVGRDRLLERAHDARLVLFGEVHVDEGPLRDGQIELLRAFFRDSKHDALGYEPGVKDAQASVLRAARELGMQVFPLEENWELLRSQGRTWERDNEVADRIHEFLAEDGKNRMFVIRGEGHIAPGGYLVGQLRVPPLIVLSVFPPRWEASDGPPAMIRTSDAQMVGGENVFVWALPEDERKQWKALVNWMQAQD